MEYGGVTTIVGTLILNLADWLGYWAGPFRGPLDASPMHRAACLFICFGGLVSAKRLHLGLGPPWGPI